MIDDEFKEQGHFIPLEYNDPRGLDTELKR